MIYPKASHPRLLQTQVQVGERPGNNTVIVAPIRSRSKLGAFAPHFAVGQICDPCSLAAWLPGSTPSNNSQIRTNSQSSVIRIFRTPICNRLFCRHRWYRTHKAFICDCVLRVIARVWETKPCGGMCAGYQRPETWFRLGLSHQFVKLASLTMNTTGNQNFSCHVFLKNL